MDRLIRAGNPLPLFIEYSWICLMISLRFMLLMALFWGEITANLVAWVTAVAMRSWTLRIGKHCSNARGRNKSPGTAIVLAGLYVLRV